MLMPWLFLAASLVGAWFTWNAFRPTYRPAPVAVVSFFAGWLTTELALHHVAWQVGMTAVFVWLGALHGWPGWAALGVSAASWLGLLRCWWRAHAAEDIVEQALRAGLGEGYAEE